ncbi:MAG: hypothetical protein NVSMB45_00890 [Ginsengibacter sp.]
MKKWYAILILFFSLISKFSFAQEEDPDVKQQRIEALKIAYISQKLQLNPTEAEKFWPIYYRYESELKQVRQESKNGDVIEKDERMLNIRKKYKNEFSGMLGSNRANSLYRSENEFRVVLLRHIQRQSPVNMQLLPKPPVNNSLNRSLPHIHK